MENFPKPGAPSGNGFSNLPPTLASANAPAKGKAAKTRGGRRKGKGNAEGENPAVTKRVVSKTRGIALTCAVIAGVVVAYAVTAEDPKTYVARSSASIGQFATIVPEQLEAVAVDPESIEPGAFSGDDPEKVLEEALEAAGNGRLQYPLSKNQQIRPEQFAVEAGLPEALTPDERLISISAVASTSVAGNIRSGDHVDVVAVSTAAGSPTASIVKTNVPVESVSLSADQLEAVAATQSDPESENYEKGVGEIVPAAPIPGSYVLRVNTTDVLKFALVDGNTDTQLYLIYRGADAVDSEAALPLYIEEALGFQVAPVE